MAIYRVNKRGVAKARELIDAHQYRVRSRWALTSSVPPTRMPFSRIRVGAGTRPGTLRSPTVLPMRQARYAFVFGDFRRLHRMGLIACYYRAAEWEHTEVMLAAHRLLLYLDKSRA